MSSELADDLAIRFSEVAKDYLMSDALGAWTGDLRDDVRSLFQRLRGQRPPRPKLRAVLKSVSFDLERGKTLALVGANGAGKSTCLKIISKITRPTRGEVLVRGRVAPLIQLGAGFHRELSGHENIYLNGAILGLSRTEIDERYHDIVSFAELEDSMTMPLKHYSSGMQVRLGFSVAVHVGADILLIDEVLAVGDASFRAKAAAKLDSVLATGNVSAIMVSHDADLLTQYCERGIYIKDGEMAMDGPLDQVLERYAVEG
ncbi:MAG: ABC transporter ATP-binding protein [Deltaproteobacteria bacterium]|nr:ABC transporter ATP-binding protein [Deltaproteobacteria bacterium]